MSTNRSSSNQNTRVFSPTVIVQQPTSRMSVILDGSGSGGYSVDSGVTGGDCIRYDYSNSQYIKSQADLDENAEVFGVVESKSGNKYTVVVYGSIKYPPERLNKLTDPVYLASIEDEDLDVLFLDPSNPGGLTAQIFIPTGASSAIVKPVLQLAPHNNYDGIVVNYLGYKIGNSVSVNLGQENIGNITQSSTPLGENYIDLSVPNLLDVTQNQILFDQFGVKSGIHYVDLTMLSSYLVSNIQNGAIVTQSSPAGNGAIGQVIAKNGNVVTISRTSSSQQIYNGYCVIGTNNFQIINNTITKFSTPVRPAETLSDGTQIKYWLNTVPTERAVVPNELKISKLTVTAGISLGNIVDVEAKINQLTSDIAQIKTRIGM